MQHATHLFGSLGRLGPLGLGLFPDRARALGLGLGLSLRLVPPGRF